MNINPFKMGWWRTYLFVIAIILFGGDSLNLLAGETKVEKSNTLLPQVVQSNFGTTTDGTAVKLFTLTNSRGMIVKVMNYGAIITEIRVPDRQGRLANVVLGSSTFEAYKSHPAAAAVIGRFANRIAKARFTLDGIEYKLAANSGGNHIHGGNRNFSRMIWLAKVLPPKAGQCGVIFTYLSKDGEEGYPGNLTTSVTYTLTDKNELRLEYEADTDKPTVVNLTNHAYFNLAGSGDSLGHELWISAKEYTPTDDQLIPTGEFAPVTGTPLDFTIPTLIGARIAQLKPRPGGYDHNYVLAKESRTEPVLFARAYEPKTGRVMEVSTTEPGVQLYTGNHVRDFVGTDGVKFGAHGGFCLETQHYPDSPNKPGFPSSIVRPGKPFRSATVFTFSVRQ